jgi:hypothetical protein
MCFRIVRERAVYVYANDNKTLLPSIVGLVIVSPTLSVLMIDAKFTFGKHAGKSFQQVLDSNKGYVSWAVQLGSPGRLSAFAEFCRAAEFHQN